MCVGINRYISVIVVVFESFVVFFLFPFKMFRGEESSPKEAI